MCVHVHVRFGDMKKNIKTSGGGIAGGPGVILTPFLSSSLVPTCQHGWGGGSPPVVTYYGLRRAHSVSGEIRTCRPSGGCLGFGSRNECENNFQVPVDASWVLITFTRKKIEYRDNYQL